MTWNVRAFVAVAALLVAGCSAPQPPAQQAAQDTTPTAAASDAEASEASEAPTSPATESEEATEAPSEAATEGDAEGTQTAGTVPAKMWANDFCGAIGSWVGGIQADNQKFTEKLSKSGNEPVAVKRTLVDFLSNTVDANKELRADIDAAGIPDVDDGEQLVASLKDALDRAFKRFDQTLQRARDLPTGNRQKFLAALNEAEAPLADIQKVFTAIERDFDESPGGKKLSRLLERAPGCA